MRHLVLAAAAVAAGVWAAPAFANPSAIDTAPSAREVQASVDAYLAPSKPDATLVGGPGQAGYDGGFWIRGGSFLMKINLTLQTRWEGFQWNDEPVSPTPGGDLSGFSLPRATLKFSGDATCNMHYYLELEFGHSGHWYDNSTGSASMQTLLAQANGLPVGTPGTNAFGPNPINTPIGAAPGQFGVDYGIAREAWIEYESCPQAAIRMGLIKTAATRQLMTPPEMQQFVDISMASAFIGEVMPGYSDRNRDYGVAVHGALGCDGEWSYLLTVTNGDGPVRRNVLDGTTSDDLAYSARVNWDIKGHMGYEEGALRQTECGWVASLGAWAHYYADARRHHPFLKYADRLTWGVDAAAGYGGWSMTAAYSAFKFSSFPGTNNEVKGYSYLGQLGYLFPNTAWEIAARYSLYHVDSDFIATTPGAYEFGGVINYYIDGHSNKLSLDVSWIKVNDDFNFLADTYAGYNATSTSDAVLVRFQWQLAL
jgi:hypothetical protein